jgi:mRNA-degrading endonuclease RelE of RelBE toxin-antitoxin system
MKYTVEVTKTAFELIQDQARYIAADCHAPLNASRWLEQIWDVVDGLESLPERHNFAPENDYKTYEVRRVLAGEYLILFTIDEPAKKVWVIGFRHGSRLPRPLDIPHKI